MIHESRKKFLVIMPDLYDYQRDICNTLEKRNYDVLVFSEQPGLIFSLIIKRLSKILNTNLFYNIHNLILYFKISKKVKSCNYLLIIRGDILNEKLILKIKKKILQEDGLSIYYTWDSFKFLNHKGSIGELFEKVFTFDLSDAHFKKWSFLPLFYSLDYNKKLSMNKIEYDFCYVGSFSLKKYDFYLKFKNENPSKRIYAKFFISKKFYYLRKLFDKNYKNIDCSILNFKKLSAKEIVNLYEKSLSILDITTEGQSGLSMRSIESIGVCRKLVTNNEDIRKYDFFNNNNIYVISNDSSCNISDDWLESKYTSSETIRNKYSIDTWVDELLRNP